MASFSFQWNGGNTKEIIPTVIDIIDKSTNGIRNIPFILLRNSNPHFLGFKPIGIESNKLSGTLAGAPSTSEDNHWIRSP